MCETMTTVRDVLLCAARCFQNRPERRRNKSVGLSAFPKVSVW